MVIIYCAVDSTHKLLAAPVIWPTYFMTIQAKDLRINLLLWLNIHKIQKILADILAGAFFTVSGQQNKPIFIF